MVLAPGIEYFCDYDKCPEKQLPEIDRMYRSLKRLKMFAETNYQSDLLKERLESIPLKYAPITAIYKLITPYGTYEAPSILKLILEVLKHRISHLLKGEGWRD